MIKGVCIHHDFGCLGSAFENSAAKRQLEMLKSMGVNSIRTGHTPPAPQFVDLADEMGMLMFEVGEEQAGSVKDLMRMAGLHDAQSVLDTRGVERVVTAKA